jgi:hypothetical protein
LRDRTLQAAQVGFGFLEFGKKALFGLKLTGVHASAAALYADGMLEVQHLVIEKVFDGATRGVGAIEDATDHDGVMCRVVVAQHAAGVVRAPGKDRATEQAVEKAGIEGVEDLVEIEVVACGAEDSFASASLADVFGLA